MSTALHLRTATPADWPAIWALLAPIFRAGDTYSFARDITEDQARQAWMDAPMRTCVATNDAGQVLGTCYIKPNQPGQGSHVCNAGYAVDASARGLGVASALCQHSQDEARALGFLAMQFNLVVSTNVGAVRLWQRLGFDIVGTLPGAFRHPTQGLVDAHVMFKTLVA